MILFKNSLESLQTQMSEVVEYGLKNLPETLQFPLSYISDPVKEVHRKRCKLR